MINIYQYKYFWDNITGTISWILITIDISFNIEKRLTTNNMYLRWQHEQKECAGRKGWGFVADAHSSGDIMYSVSVYKLI